MAPAAQTMPRIRDHIKHLVSVFDHAAFAALVAAAEKQPALFRVAFPDDISDLPAKLWEIQHELDSALSEGLGIPAAQAFGNRHDLARCDISSNPWLDRLVVEGYARHGRKGGKVAYWSPS